MILQEPDKDKIEITGDNIDVVKIATSLRKVGFVEVVSVALVPEKKEGEKKGEGDKKKDGEKKGEGEKKEGAKGENPPDWRLPCLVPKYFYVVSDDPSLCSIL
ncbi:hypothetical protein NMG60_11003298 [Bertholletia excelsa]